MSSELLEEPQAAGWPWPPCGPVAEWPVEPGPDDPWPEEPPATPFRSAYPATCTRCGRRVPRGTLIVAGEDGGCRHWRPCTSRALRRAEREVA